MYLVKIRTTDAIFELSPKTRKGKVFILPDGKFFFYCPCNKTASLHGGNTVGWKLVSEEPLTFEGSFRTDHDGKKCHFFIKKGLVDWCSDTAKRD